MIFMEQTTSPGGSFAVIDSDVDSRTSTISSASTPSAHETDLYVNDYNSDSYTSEPGSNVDPTSGLLEHLQDNWQPSIPSFYGQVLGTRTAADSSSLHANNPETRASYDEEVLGYGDHSAIADATTSPEGFLSRLNPTKFWSSRDIIIAVLGMTGAGKTSFIAKVTGRNDLEIGHGLKSCTQDIEVIQTQIDGHKVYLVDTPGFADTVKSDIDVLNTIVVYLAGRSSKDVKLSGIIYLHPITDSRMMPHSQKNLDMLQQLTGQDNLRNIVFTMSKWNQGNVEAHSIREQQLRSEFWLNPIAKGAQVERDNGTSDSAQAIVRNLVQRNIKPFRLQIQDELARPGVTVSETSAGRVIAHEIETLKEQHKKNIQKLAEKLSQATSSSLDNKRLVEELEEKYQKELADLREAVENARRINTETINELKDRIKKLEKEHWCLVM